MRPADAPPGRAERWLTALVGLYPPATRARFGTGMRYALSRDYRAARGRGRWAAAAFWLASAVGLVWHGMRDRWTADRGGRARPEGIGRVWRTSGGGTWTMEHRYGDLKRAARRLARRPAFALGAVATLALGIGPTAAIFTIVDSVLLEPLPYPEPDRLVRVVQQNRPDNRWNVSMADFLGIREEQRVFESVAVVQVVGTTAELTGSGAPERVRVGRVSADWLRVLGVTPAEGRDFRPGEDRPGQAAVTLVSASFRDRVFGRGGDVLGRSLTLDGTPHTIVGVLAPDRASLAGIEADVWPLLTVDTPPRRGPFFWRGVARLRDDRSLEEARQDLDGISRRLFTQWADTGFRDDQARLTPYPLEELLVGTAGDGLWLMLLGVSGVLLIAVSNVASLFLIRAAERDGEMVVRASLGATRGRIATELLLESFLIAAAAGALGAGLAWWGVDLFLATDPALPRAGEIGLDATALALVSAVTLGAGLVFGLAPLVRARTAGGGALGDTARGGRSPGWTRARAALVAAEFAIAFSLTAGAGVLVGSFQRLRAVDPGFDGQDVVALSVALPSGRYEGYPETLAFWTEAVDAVAEVPGLASVAAMASLPPGGPGSAGTNDFELLDRPVAEGESAPQVLWNYASPGFGEALGVPVLRGRGFTDADRDGPSVVLVSESWARRFYPGEEVLGRQLYGGGDRSVAFTVVGVVGDVKYQGLDAIDDAAVYEPVWQGTIRSGWLVMRAHAGELDAGLAGARATLRRLDADLPLDRAETLVERTERTLDRPRQWTALLGLLAGLGLALACVGVYGVLSYHVSTQRREIGVRVSLGARPGVVRRYVVARGMMLAALGVGAGLGLSVLAGRWLRAVVFEVSPLDPLALGVAATALLGAAFVACAVPAVRATRIDPVEALRDG